MAAIRREWSLEVKNSSHVKSVLYSTHIEVKMKKVIIDGRCIKRGKFDGAQRYATEILLELDKIVPSGKYELLIRPEAKDLIDLKQIRKVEISGSCILLWRLKTFSYLLRHSAWYINFSNGPAIWSKSIITLHDIYAFYNVCNNTKMYYLKKKCAAILNVIVAKRIVTVSQYSKSTMIAKLPISPEKISVIYNAWQHISTIIPDVSILEREHLQTKEFYFFIGRLVNNKNINWIFNVADYNPDDIFVISGAISNEKFKFYYGKNNNIIYTGFISDAEMAALYQHCKAFLFPSLMEGFGIPPLEALYYGAAVIISNTSSLPEIYEDCAHYIDPLKYDYCLNEILQEPVGSAEKILRKFSWEKSAWQWYELIESYTG